MTSAKDPRPGLSYEKKDKGVGGICPEGIASLGSSARTKLLLMLIEDGCIEELSGEGTS